MRPTFVSVITPTWQRHDLLLTRCVPSVAAQSYAAVEHVVISDGPDPELDAWDETAALVTVFDQLPEHPPEPHWGAAVRRRGLELATGGYIAYLDDDDAYRPHHCATLAAALDANPDADFAYSLMSSQGDTVGTAPPSYCNIGTPMIMHRRETLQFGTWGPDGIAEDWDLVERWLQAGARYVHVPEITVDVWPSAYR